MGVNVSREFTDAGNTDPVTKVMFQLSLRTLGDVKFTQGLGSGSSSTQ